MQEIARLRFNKLRKCYDFTASGPLAVDEIVPPHVYGLPDDERNQLLSSKFLNARCGGWTGHMHHWAMRMLATGGWDRYK
jgi:hypothetical protein